MSAGGKHSFLTWLLPLLILRAFVPAGFMLMGSGDGLQMVVCSGTGPATSQMESPSDQHAHAEHLHHGHDGAASSQHDHQNSQAHEGSYCPFAIAAFASALTIPYAFEAEPTPVQAPESVVLPKLRSASILIDRIRGPPHA
jgi:hypothetical protein